jgi:hypothetical protein
VSDNFSGLGSFDVTVTTYNHLMLTCEERSSKHPSMIGPLFIHVKKDFAAYHFFASSLVSRRPDLQQLKCFGSDGKAVEYQAQLTSGQ